MTKKTKDDQRFEETRNQLARALADYDNFRKRVERERDQFKKIANLELIIRLLPVYDMLSEAQGNLKDSGIALTIKEFEETLKDEGVEKIKVNPGDTFNEEVHEAVEVTDRLGKKNGEIVKEALTGWRYKDGPVIRPTKVVVFKKS